MWLDKDLALICGDRFWGLIQDCATVGRFATKVELWGTLVRVFALEAVVVPAVDLRLGLVVNS